jgi:hypothetical protein
MKLYADEVVVESAAIVSWAEAHPSAASAVAS